MKYLLPTTKKEFIRVNSVGDSTADEWHPVEDQWRFIWVLEKQLTKHIENDSNNKEGNYASSDEHGGGFIK